MCTANKVLIYRWFEEVWNKKRESAIFEMLDANAVIHGLADSPAEVIRGPEGFIPFWRKFIDAFPNLTVVVDSVLAEDDKVAARCTVSGMHTGKGLGIEPTGVSMAFTGICLVHVRDGMLAEGWNHFDFLTLYQQLGLLKLPNAKT